MKLEPELSRRVEEYLSQVEENLRARPPAVRREIMDSLRRHIHEALAARSGSPSTEEVDLVLADMDPPESFAAEGETSVTASAMAPPVPLLRWHWFLLACTFLALNGWAVWKWSRAPAQGDGRVLRVQFSARPDQPLQGQEPLSWAFNEDVVGSEAVGAPKPEGPVSLRPAVPGRYLWKSPRVLVFTPDGTWPLCSEFESLLDAEFFGSLGMTFRNPGPKRFRTPALNLASVAQVDFTPDRRATLRLQFNAPTDTRLLGKFLSLATSSQSNLSYEISAPAPSSAVVLVQTEMVEQDAIEVTLEPGVPASTGPLGLEKRIVRQVPLSSSFRLTGVEAASPSFEQPSVTLSFSTAPDAQGAREFIEVQPAASFSVEPLNSWWSSGLRLTGGFEPGRVYTVTLKPGLRSESGLSLAQPITRRVNFPSRDPALCFSAEGRYLSPSGSLRIPLMHVNARECRLAAYPVPPQNLIQLALREAGRMEHFWAWGGDGLVEKLTAPAWVYPTNALDSRPETVARTAVDLARLTEGPPRGAYWLTAEPEKGQGTRQLVMITDLGLSVKSADDGMLVWVNSLSAAQPVADVEVKLYAENNVELASGTTDGDGLSFLALDEKGWEQSPLLVVASLSNDVSCLNLDQGGVSLPAGEGDRAFLAEGYEAYVFTARGVFRPGETIETKAVVRDRALKCPEPFPVLFRIVRPDGRVFRDVPAMLDPLGAAEMKIEMPDYLPTGQYTVELDLPGTFKTLGSTVIAFEDFFPPQVRVDVKPPADPLQPGVESDFTVHADHLFGKPAAGLPVSGFVVWKTLVFEPKGWADFIFGDGEKEFTAIYSSAGQGRLDEAGGFEFPLEPSAGWRPPARLQAVISGTVMESGGRAVTASAACPFDPYPFYIGLKNAATRMAAVGAAQSLELALVRPDEQLLATNMALRVNLYRSVWNTVLKRNAQNRFTYQSEQQLIPAGEELVQLQDGRVLHSFKVDQAGSYLLRVTDPASGASSSLRFYATEPGGTGVAWGGDRPDKVALTADRDAYAPGESARVTIQAPFAGTALLTVENDRILDRRVVRMTNSSELVEIPLRDEYAPGVYAAVTMIRPAVAESVWTAHRAAGIAYLPVKPAGRRLTVAVEAPEILPPQQAAKIKVRVAGEQGPVADADVTLMAVDEGICMLTDFQTPDPLAWFLAPRWFATSLYDLYSLLMPLLDDEATAAVSPPGDGEEGLGKRLNPIRTRRFKPLALWKSGIRTDASGEAEVMLDIPEFAGRLRLMAVAFTRDQAGSAERAALVKRSLVVQTSLPRFLAPGDEAEMTVSLFNETDDQRAARIRVTCGGPLSVEKSEWTQDLAAQASAVLRIPLRAGAAPGAALCQVEVASGTDVYRESVELSVRPVSPREIRFLHGEMKAGAQFTIEAPDDWIAESVWGELLCLSGPEGRWKGALDWLTAYPYGCIEQVTSTVFPLLYLDDMRKTLWPDLAGPEADRETILSGVYRVLSMQLGNGGFSLWPGGTQVYPWGSLYATHFLIEARKAGIPVPEDRLDSALAWVRGRLDARAPADASPDSDDWQTDMEERTYACLLLALAGTPSDSWMSRLEEQASLLRPGTRINLALALMHGGEPGLAGGVLERLGIPPPGMPRARGRTLNSDVRDAALLLSAWLERDPKNPLAPQLARWLDDAQQDGRWLTTQDNAFALMALGKYARTRPRDPKPWTAEWAANGAPPVVSGPTNSFRRANGNVPWPASGILANRGPGEFFYTVRLEGVPAADRPAAERDDGLQIRREWLDLDGNPVDPESVPQGQLVVVKLTLDTLGEPMDNLVIEDLLPAGFDVENPALATAQVVPWIRDRETGVAGRQARDDRMLFFTGSISGRHAFYYSMRAVTPGEYVVPPSVVECMYDPALRSVNGGGRAIVLE
ncbi:MAG TPA: MG2 domain-containing protein [Kiritimatiellia bacterium]|nr:MG2 domain-containing protein [Kiritimatiellia bacterium]